MSARDAPSRINAPRARSAGLPAGNLASFEAAQALAREVYWGLDQDPTKGVLWYHADYVSPYWRRHFAEGPTIGRHIFYSDRKAASAQPAAQLASR